jgi:hypothetical protein
VRRMIKSNVLAHSVVTVTGVGYVLCRLISAVAPAWLFNIGQSWIHTVNLESVRTTGSMSFSMFIIGFVYSYLLLEELRMNIESNYI